MAEGPSGWITSTGCMGRLSRHEGVTFLSRSAIGPRVRKGASIRSRELGLREIENEHGLGETVWAI